MVTPGGPTNKDRGRDPKQDPSFLEKEKCLVAKGYAAYLESCSAAGRGVDGNFLPKVFS